MSEIENLLNEAAAAMPYPPTPRFRTTPASRSRPALRPALALLALVSLLALTLLAVPSARAGLLAFLQIGRVRVLVTEAPVTATFAPEQTPVSQRVEATMSAPAGLGLNDLSGETTLQAARESLDFPVYTPAYPPDLGDPDRVFVQDIGGPLVVLVWTDSAEADRAVLSLHILGPGVVGMKGPPPILAETEVNGSYALWTSGPYLLNYRGFHQPLALVVEGQVLIWEAHGLTYRLETDLPLEEAIRIGESLGE